VFPALRQDPSTSTPGVNREPLCNAPPAATLRLLASLGLIGWIVLAH
jgi:hypothetical protein